MSAPEVQTAQSIPLNSLESRLMRFKGGISACNLFQTDDKKAAIASLHSRFQKIVSANPWLKGSCSKGKNRQVYLNYDAAETDAVPLIFSAEAKSSISENSEYSDLLSACEPYIVEKAFKLYGKKDRLTKLTILHLDDKRFLLMFSLSHLIGDGNTFYQIFNMLSVDCEVRSLGVARKSEADQVRDIIPEENARFIFSPRMIFWAIGRAFSKKKMVIKSFQLNDGYVQKQKQAAMANGIVPFVSTNDILSTTYAQLCKTKALIMAVNFRERIPEVTQNDAGNYEELLVIDENTTSNSESFRLLMNDLAGKVKKLNLPKGPDRSRSRPVLITSWAGFSQPMVLEHAREMLHVPLYTSREITFDSCIVYRPDANSISALLFMKDLTEEKVLSHPLFAIASRL